MRLEVDRIAGTMKMINETKEVEYDTGFATKELSIGELWFVAGTLSDDSIEILDS